MLRIGGAIQCALKASDMSRADGGMSGYAALTRPTELSRGTYSGRAVEQIRRRGNGGMAVQWKCGWQQNKRLERAALPV